MSLPWFAFHIDAYLGDTLTLDAEGHGAYLLLMLHYYRTGTPPPDNDRALANICRLPLDRWLALRPLLVTFFDVQPGGWHHDRIAAEMQEASNKHAASIARAQAGAEARWGKKSPKHPPRMPKASIKDSPQDATGKNHPSGTPQAMPKAMPQASSEQSSKDAHRHKQDSGGGVVTRARDPAGDLDQVPGFLDPDKLIVRNPDDMVLVTRFVAAYGDTMSSDWQGLFDRFVAAETAPPPPKVPKVPKPKAKARVEVNKRPDPEPLRAAKSIISEDAYALAAKVAEAIGLPEGHPASVGAPMLMQAWLSSWPADLIIQTVSQVMAKRSGDPPGTMKYFENAIARAFADIQRPMPVVTTPKQETLTHDQRHRGPSKSVANAAGRLAEQFAALTGSGAVDGDREGEVAGGAIPPG